MFGLPAGVLLYVNMFFEKETAKAYLSLPWRKVVWRASIQHSIKTLYYLWLNPTKFVKCLVCVTCVRDCYVIIIYYEIVKGLIQVFCAPLFLFSSA